MSCNALVIPATPPNTAMKLMRRIVVIWRDERVMLLNGTMPTAQVRYLVLAVVIVVRMSVVMMMESFDCKLN